MCYHRAAGFLLSEQTPQYALRFVQSRRCTFLQPCSRVVCSCFLVSLPHYNAVGDHYPDTWPTLPHPLPASPQHIVSLLWDNQNLHLPLHRYCTFILSHRCNDLSLFQLAPVAGRTQAGQMSGEQAPAGVQPEKELYCFNKGVKFKQWVKKGINFFLDY